FFNLPDDKREQILSVAIDEFASNDYASVSISRMVARAGIAKGSFYQYFDGKDDLFNYLFELIAQLKSQRMSLDHPDPQHVGVFAYMRWMAQVGIEFELEYPKLFQIGYRAINSGDFPKEFEEKMQAATLDFYVRLITLGKTQGDIREEVDVSTAAFVFDSTFSKLGKYLFQRITEARGPGWEGEQPFFEMPEVIEIFEGVLDLLESGMGAPSRDVKEAIDG
ncbi:MAG: TetR/AcrR family transcriptional regulator, partial [Caldilineaceae bacterium]|nr:TetR/AcrR family transcriptional regulator [Caldilineaceae bacterium]